MEKTPYNLNFGGIKAKPEKTPYNLNLVSNIYAEHSIKKNKLHKSKELTNKQIQTMKKIFVICSVRGMDENYRRKLEDYVTFLEIQGHKVHLPHRDTDQTAKGFDICMQNANAITKADEVHIFYNSKSQGTHFDMGVAFALRKKLVIVETEELTEGKSFTRMLNEWQDLSK